MEADLSRKGHTASNPHSGSQVANASTLIRLLILSFVNNKGLWFFILFIYFWLCWVFVGLGGLSLVAVRGLITAVASLTPEHRL